MSTIAPSLAPASPNAKRALLAERLRQAAEGPAPRPLSFAQQRLWFLEQLEPGTGLYNLATVARLTGNLDRVSLDKALTSIVARHEVLRTRFTSTEEGPLQVVDKSAEVKVQLVDLKGHPSAEIEMAIRQEVNRPFDLSASPLLRATLVWVKPDEYVLVLNMHHIVSDEWSMKVFFREFAALYAGYVRGETVILPELSIQYGDFSVWQRNWIQGRVLEQQLSFWRTQLSGNPPVTEWPTDHSRCALTAHPAGNQHRGLSRELSEGVKQLAEKLEATLFMVLLAAFKALLHRHTQQEDIVVGSPFAGRNRSETEQLIGFFVNALPLRTNLGGDPTFEELVRRVREVALSASEHQDLPLEKLVEALQPERSLSHLPFTKLMFVVQNDVREELQLPGLKLKFETAESALAKFDLTFFVQETAHGLVTQVEYNADLFEPETIARLLQQFERLLEGSVANPKQRVSALPLLSRDERQRLLVDWNRTATEYPRDKCIHELFEAQAERTPKAIAVEFGTRTLTYRQLNERANQLARHLRQFDIRPDVLVGLCVERSVEMVVGLLAILKAGGAYVPLDANYPAERLAFMLADTQTPVLLTQLSLKSRLPAQLRESQGRAAPLAVVCLDADWDVIGTESRENLPNSAKPESLAYVMYTSGSTGKPKGVAVPHRAVNRLVRNTNYIQLDATDRLAQVSNVSFDAATLEVWGSLLNGGRLVGISQEVALRPKEFANELRERGITAMFLTSALFNQVASEAPDAFNTLRTIMAGGEALDPKWVRVVLKHLEYCSTEQALHQTRVVNGYGPTENTTFTCCHHITTVPEEATNIPIGRPISNTQVYILDTHMNPVPIGVPGELYTGGDGLARGYWNRPELTAEKFVPNPFATELAPERNGHGEFRMVEKRNVALAEPSADESPVGNPMHLSKTLYRTGDLARYLADGSIEFLGRIDHQVKVRGFRIELGEIESVLGQHPGVSECVVAVRGQSAGERRLVAYFVADKNGAPNASVLRELLETKLPEYMVPAAFVQLNALPLTPNGKVDRNALPEPEQTRPELEPKYVAPRDEVEVRLTKIWEDVLGVHPIGIRDKFFELGGHSLLAVRLSAQIEKAFGTKLRLATIFQAPTVEQLARHLRPESKTAEPACQSSIVELHHGVTKAPLFLVHGAGGGMFWGYANLSRHLRPQQTVYGFKSRGLDGKEEFGSIEEMAAEYVADLRKVKPQGPYYLGGYCFGGNVAYEMARQLERAGESVALLALMNCAPPNSRYGRINWSPLWWVRLVRNLIYWGHYFREWTPAQRSGFFRWKWRSLKRKLGALFGAATGRRSRGEVSALVDLSSFTPEERKVWEAHIRALVLFHPQPYGGPIHLFRSPGHPLWCSFEPDYGWSEFARGGVTITVVPGTHEKILEEPCVAVLAAELEKLLPEEEATTGFMTREQVEMEPSASPSREADLAFWTQQLRGAAALLELPTDHPRPAVQSCRTGIESQTLPLGLTNGLRALSHQFQAEGAGVFLAAVTILLQRYSRQDDILLGTQADGLLVLRVNQAGDPALPELLERLRAISAEASRHQSVAFEEIAATLLPEKPQSYHAVVQVAFSRSAVAVHGTLPGTGLDLAFQAVEDLDAITLRIEYARDLFEPDTIRRLLGHWETLLGSMVANPQGRLSELGMLPAGEQHQVVVEWNHTAAEYPRQKTLSELFEEQVQRTPGAEALLCGGTRLTYAELYARATAVAIHLRSLGVGKDTLTGICLGRSEEMVIGILGTLQAGGAYVPLDPNYPRERLAFMLEDAQVAVLLTQQKLLGRVPPGHAKVVCVEDLLPSDPHSGEFAAFGVHPLGCPPPANTLKNENRCLLAAGPSQAENTVRAPSKPHPSVPASSSSNLAYVIYTSGSTGKPKGVALEHRGAVALVSWARNWFSPEELSGVLASTSICFDLSIFELFVPLCTGGKVILAENALALPTLAAANEVTLINTVPSAMRELLRLKGVPSSVRVVNLAGEPLPTALVEQIYHETAAQKVYDLYGPTETTTYSTGALRKSGEPATIGRPLANEQVYLLDRHLQPVPIGVAGELFIGGDGLARGYLNRPELTAEKFITVAFAGQDAERRRLYRTGDLARWRADGKLEFLGRLDHQVKIRGFRIELGEVEAALKKHPEVAEAVVVAREEPFRRLVAYVVRQKGKTVTPESLRLALGEQLPDYMVPSVFVFLEALPLTPNGKVDRKALPAPSQEQRSISGEFVAPTTPVQERLAAIWREVLGPGQVGVADNFFELGGHSLLAIQTISRIREAFGVELPLSALYERPTIQELAQGLAGGQWSSSPQPVLALKPTERTGSIPVSFVQERLWFLDQLEPNSAGYNVPAALRLKGKLEVALLQRAFEEVIRRHEALRTTLHLSEGTLTQVVADHIPFSLPVEEALGANGGERGSRARELVQAEARQPFDLSRGPLIRARLVRLGEREHILVVVMHHSVSDGWSLAILFQELGDCYRAFIAGLPVPQLPALTLQYRDFAHWQRQWMQGAVLDSELNYWKEKLLGAPSALELPTDAVPATESGPKASRRRIQFSEPLARAIVRSRGASADGPGQPERNRPVEGGLGSAHTPFTVLMTALALTLHKWTGQKDLVLGTVVAGRGHKELENLIGCFINFLPIRITMEPGETGRKILERVRAAVVNGQSHQNCPFERMVEAINPERRLNQNPLYNVGLLLQNYPAELFQSETLEAEQVEVDTETALLDLRFEAEQTAHGLSLMCEYRTDLFAPETIEALLASCQKVSESLVQAPDLKVSEFKLTSALEAQAAAAQARRDQPTLAIASTFTAEPVEEPLRYWAKELELPVRIEFAPYNQVFQQLLDHGSLLNRGDRGLKVLLLRLEDWQRSGIAAESTNTATPDETLERNADEFFVALKGAAARGGPWLVCLCPASSTLAADAARAGRLAEVEKSIAARMKELGGVYVVTPAEMTEWYPVPDYYDASGDELGHVPYTPLFFTALGTVIARKFHALNRLRHKVIVLDCDHTLWSGVCGEDGAAGIRLDPPRQYLQEFMRRQRAAGMLLCLASKNNEEDVHEVFARRLDMPLRQADFVACRLNWQPKSQNLKSLAEELHLGLDSFIFIDDNPVECADVEANCPEVLTLQLPEAPEQIPQFLNHCWVFDHLKLTAEDRQRAEMYRQNQEREELRAQSPKLSDFLAQLELKIQIEPLLAEQTERVSQLTQRTNQFNFTGRRRTELEVQQLMAKNASDVLTVQVSDRFGDYGLVGAIIFGTKGTSLDLETLVLSCRVLGRGVEHKMLARLGEIARERQLKWVDAHFIKTAKNQPALEFLQSVGGHFKQAQNGGLLFRFPAGYAAAAAFNPQHDEAPPTGTAKAQGENRARANTNRLIGSRKFSRCRAIALEFSEATLIHRRIESKALTRSRPGTQYTAPHTELERKLCEAWQSLLHLQRVGLQDNFFALGGHSLLAVRLFTEIEKITGQKFPLVTIFQAPTVAELARVLSQGKATPARSLLVPIQPEGSKPPLFLVHGAGGDVLWGYANLAAHLGSDQPVYGLKSRGQAGLEEFTNLVEMAACYLKEVRTFQPQGPYYLGGYCFGGNVAFEMARQLRACGQAVALVALFDSAPSNIGYEQFTWWQPTFLWRFMRNSLYWLDDFRQLQAQARRRFIVRKAGALGRKLKHAWRRGGTPAPVDLEEVIETEHFPEHELKLWQVHLTALVQHVEQPFPGKATLLRTRGQPLFCSLAEDFCWSKVATGGVSVKRIPGSHEQIFMEPNVQILAEELSRCLAEAQTNTGPHPRKMPVNGNDLPSSLSHPTCPPKQPGSVLRRRMGGPG